MCVGGAGKRGGRDMVTGLKRQVPQLSLSREDARRDALTEPAFAHAELTENGVVLCLPCRIPR